MLTTSIAQGDAADFYALGVDPLSVVFGPGGAMEAHGRGHVEDVDGDDGMDLVLHFHTQETGIQCGDREGTLNGETWGGTPIAGSDAIKTVGCGKNGAGGAAKKPRANYLAIVALRR